MINAKNNIKLMVILIYTFLVGAFILISSFMESTLIISIIILMLSFSIVVIYIVSRDILPKFMVLMVAGANIITMVATIVKIALIV
ncbi:TPA: hypothetical protein PR959_001609 [Staphylococcus aureus]|nr:hypothetical protein [Staphylococcus aureus]HDG4884458.1 hypothetical protein [Staphylococcus aureus]HDK3864930.1 hypothetical protein [Staphylococcus aureus]HEO8862702.1 hypothetical protein [Staphylococcus aureus]